MSIEKAWFIIYAFIYLILIVVVFTCPALDKVKMWKRILITLIVAACAENGGRLVLLALHTIAKAS